MIPHKEPFCLISSHFSHWLFLPMQEGNHCLLQCLHFASTVAEALLNYQEFKFTQIEILSASTALNKAIIFAC